MMKKLPICFRVFPVMIASIMLFTSCGTLDKTSMHGFNSGYYKLDSAKKTEKVYVDVSEEKIDVYHQNKKMVNKENFMSIPLKSSDSIYVTPLKFKKQSLDIDLTTILLKYRPMVQGLPPQLTTDLNIAIYAGWRHDTYKLTSNIDPLGKRYHKINNVGYDFGVFTGPGTTLVNPFSTNNKSSNEYNGMIIQAGLAGFLESNVASFGFAAGFDHLLSNDRNIWIYQNKPWFGFVIGIALN